MLEDFSGQPLGEYLLIRWLGRGQFGEVYLAEHRHNHSPCAIKILSATLEESSLADFLTEARAFRLEHPNIVRIRDFGIEHQRLYLVMDYTPNGTLRQRHPKKTILPWEDIVPYIKQMAEGLQCMHDKGLVHRDIKPENILIGLNGELLLGDFGIATTSYTWNFHTQVARGSASYISPEQINGKAVRASDQYSVGIMIYEWLTGEPPFVGSSREILIQQQVAAPTPVRVKNPSVSPQVEELVMRLLEKEPEKRFASMREFIAHLERVQVQPVSIQEFIFREQDTGIRAVAWSPNEHYIASGGCDSTVQVWDVTTGTVVFPYHGHVDEVWSVAWSPDSKYVVSAGADKTVQVWEATTGYPAYSETQIAMHDATVRTVAWSPDGRYIASAGDDEVVNVWDASDGSLISTYRRHKGEVCAVAWSPIRPYLACGGKDTAIHIWSMAGDIPPRICEGHNQRIMSLSWSPDGEYLAVGGDDGLISIWHAATGEMLHSFVAHDHAVAVVAWSPDSKFIASGSWDTTIRIWEKDGTEAYFIYRKHEKWVNSLAWSPDGRYLVSGSWDKTAHIIYPHWL